MCFACDSIARVTAAGAAAFRPAVEQHPGVICYPTVGFGDTMEDRYRHVELLDDMGLARQGAVDTGSVNLGHSQGGVKDAPFGLTHALRRHGKTETTRR